MGVDWGGILTEEREMGDDMSIYDERKMLPVK